MKKSQRIALFLLFSCVFHLISCTKQSDTDATPGSSARSEKKTELPKLSAKDHEFVAQAARANLGEVRIAQLAAERSESQAVKDFSERLVKDHTKAHEELQQIFTKRGVMLPDGLTDEQAAAVQHLRPLKGEEFDQALQKHAVEDHQKAIETFREAAEKGEDPEVKAYAKKVLPVLQQHFETAKGLEPSQASNP